MQRKQDISVELYFFFWLYVAHNVKQVWHPDLDLHSMF